MQMRYLKIRLFIFPSEKRFNLNFEVFYIELGIMSIDFFLRAWKKL